MNKYTSEKTVARMAASLALLIMTLLMARASRADERRSCFAVNTSPTTLVVRGDALRIALLRATEARLTDDRTPQNVPVPKDLPADPKRCTGVNASIPDAAPTRANYYGTINNKDKFRRMAGLDCNGASQYFSIGNAIYYRNCAGGAGNNYIYFWGKQDGNASACFGSTYPEMFAVANTKANPVTFERMRAVFTGKKPDDDQPGFALGNIMAAILISEAARDNLVIPANYMLISPVDKGGPTVDQVIGGHCAVGATPCNNPANARDGVHPLAWGGAQAVMMTGGWGTNNGATSDFGQAFETDLVVKWLKANKKIELKKGDCESRAWGIFEDAQRKTLTQLFEDAF